MTPDILPWGLHLLKLLCQRRLNGKLDGHAWVEVNGVPVAEGNLARITVQFRQDNRRSVP